MRALSIGLVFVLLGGIVLTGCAGKGAIDLRYKTTGINLEPCPGSIAVVELVDKRPQTAIGKTKDDKAFYAKSSVTAWVSRALHDELAEGGCKVEYHQKPYDFDTDFILTGDLEEIFVTQKSYSDYAASVKLRIVVTSGGKRVFNQTFSSRLGKTAFPSSGVRTQVLAELLQGMMRELVPELRDGLRK